MISHFLTLQHFGPLFAKIGGFVYDTWWILLEHLEHILGNLLKNYNQYDMFKYLFNLIQTSISTT